MAKIKDNIDLKELEKFGFIFYKDMLMQRYVKGNLKIFINNCGEKETYIKCKLQPLVERVIYTNVYYMEEPQIADIDNVLFDLIQAGFVEKVQDE